MRPTGLVLFLAGCAPACAAPAGFADDAQDCNDADPQIDSGGAEICGDGIESDCDADGVFDCESAECTGDPGGSRGSTSSTRRGPRRRL